MWNHFNHHIKYKVPEPELCRAIHLLLGKKISTKLKWEAKTMSWDISVEPTNSKRVATFNFYEDYACAPDENELLCMIENLLPSDCHLFEDLLKTSIQSNGKLLVNVENSEQRANTLARLYLQIVNYKK